MNKIVQPQWLEWAKELQFIAQGGLTYSKDVFDIERFERIREIAAEMLSLQSGIPIEKVKNLFCNETGFQTPKLDTRAAIFKDDKILLVKEKNGTWSLPGGWVDINQSIKTNTEKEVKEEAGLNVKAIRVIAIQDRNLHNIPPYAYNVCKVFVLCEIESGSFRPNIETDESAYFGLEELPILAKEKNNEEQIKMCFLITAKPKAHAFKNEMCFPLTKTKCELKKHPNSKFECFFNDFNRTKTSLFLPFPSKLIQDNLVCVLELQE